MKRVTVECVCSGEGECPLYGRAITDREYHLCKGDCDYPAFCDPPTVMRRRIRLANEQRQKNGQPLLIPPDARPITKPTTGPGTKLKAIIQRFGISSEICKSGCGDFADKMDLWGVKGCKERKKYIVEKLSDNINTMTNGQLFKAAWNSIGPMFSGWFNPLRPEESLVDEAIRQAEEESKTSNKSHEPTAEETTHSQQ